MCPGLGVSEPDQLVDQDLLRELDQDWELACEIPALAEKQGRTGWPICEGQPAQWVAWRPNCCPESPRYILMCGDCKGVYQRWLAQFALIHCGWCGVESSGPVAYTPLNRNKT